MPFCMAQIMPDALCLRHRWQTPQQIEGGKPLRAGCRIHDRRNTENSIQEVPTMRVKITLACTECKRRNYVSKKNKKNDPDRIEMKKHCRFCNKHTIHKETK